MADLRDIEDFSDLLQAQNLCSVLMSNRVRISKVFGSHGQKSMLKMKGFKEGLL